MSTLKEVRKFIRKVDKDIEMFGADDEFMEFYMSQALILRNTVCIEEDKNKTEFKNLPPETELGPMARHQYQVLKDYYRRYNPDLID